MKFQSEFDLGEEVYSVVLYYKDFDVLCPKCGSKCGLERRKSAYIVQPKTEIKCVAADKDEKTGQVWYEYFINGKHVCRNFREGSLFRSHEEAVAECNKRNMEL